MLVEPNTSPLGVGKVGSSRYETDDCVQLATESYSPFLSLTSLVLFFGNVGIDCAVRSAEGCVLAVLAAAGVVPALGCGDCFETNHCPSFFVAFADPFDYECGCCGCCDCDCWGYEKECGEARRSCTRCDVVQTSSEASATIGATVGQDKPERPTLPIVVATQRNTQKHNATALTSRRRPPKQARPPCLGERIDGVGLLWPREHRHRYNGNATSGHPAGE